MHGLWGFVDGKQQVHALLAACNSHSAHGDQDVVVGMLLSVGVIRQGNKIQDWRVERGSMQRT
jgi:hypothetical protein